VVGGTSGSRFRRSLVVAQVALSLLLLVGAGLFTRSLANLRALDPGFRPDRLVTFRVDPALSGHDPGERLTFFDRLTEVLRAEPGVEKRLAETRALPTRTASPSPVRFAWPASHQAASAIDGQCRL